MTVLILVAHRLAGFPIEQDGRFGGVKPVDLAGDRYLLNPVEHGVGGIVAEHNGGGGAVRSRFDGKTPKPASRRGCPTPGFAPKRAPKTPCTPIPIDKR